MSFFLHSPGPLSLSPSLCIYFHKHIYRIQFPRTLFEWTSTNDKMMELESARAVYGISRKTQKVMLQNVLSAHG